MLHKANRIIIMVREWYNGSIVAFQAIDPGSTPGSRMFSSNSDCNIIKKRTNIFLIEIFLPEVRIIRLHRCNNNKLHSHRLQHTANR